MRAMIRVAIVDDHAAVHAGLDALLRATPDVTPVGVAERAEQVAPLLYRTQPDAVLLDYQLPGTDGLTICRRITADVPAPAVVLYSAFADDALVIPAIVAGASGLVHKGGQARELFETLRAAARGENAMPAPSPQLIEAAAHALDRDDMPVLEMLVERVPKREVAAALRCSPGELEQRIERMLDAMRSNGAAAAGP